MSTDLKHAKDFSTQIIPNLTGRIFSHHTAEVFMDIGTPENYAAANDLPGR
jgi:NDP-sugar pyrophosphorylase family protein